MRSQRSDMAVAPAAAGGTPRRATKHARECNARRNERSLSAGADPSSDVARAKVQQEALPDPSREVVVAEREQSAGDRESHVGEPDPDERCQLPRDQHFVDDELEQPDLGGVHGRDEHEED